MTTTVPISKTTRNTQSVNPLVFNVSDPVNGNAFINDGQTFLVLDNKSAPIESPAVTITIQAVGMADVDLTIGNRIFSLSAGNVIVAGPFDRSIFNQPDGTVLFTTSAVLPIVVLTLSA